MTLLRRLFCHSLRKYLISLALAVLLTALILWLRGGLRPLGWADAMETAGAVLILLGLLGLMARLGAFDTVGYAFSSLRSERRWKDLYEYSAAKKESRAAAFWGFMPLVTTGAAFLLAGMIISAALR